MIVFNSQSQSGKKNNVQRRDEESYSNVEKNANINDIQRQKHETNVQHPLECTITRQALQYAVHYQLPPIKITCQPQVKDQVEGTNLIKALFTHIKENFCKINKYYNRPIGFDTWYVDNQGALVCFTRQIELFVYLWDVSHYPSKLLNITITPILPTHLPPQHSIILKFVPAMISFDEVLEAVSEICQSKFLLEEMKGSMTNKSRHIRLDIASKEEMRKILNSGVVPLNGHLIEVTEFLAPPQILICSRCNQPGHVKKECKGPFDRCRRCGLNKAQGEHQQCPIKCHHCEGDHLAVDYRCPVIVKFRSDLIKELRRRPELLPQNVQLFIPVEFREGGKNVIGCQQRKYISSPSSPPLINAWPTLQQSVSSADTDRLNPVMFDNMLQEMKNLRNDYENLKLDFDRREKELTIKHEKYKTKVGAMLNLLVNQNNHQNECIMKVYTVVNEVVPVITNSLKALHTIMEKVIINTNDMNLKNDYKAFQDTMEQGLMVLDDRNDLIIEHQRSTTILNEKTNQLLQHGIELLSVNEQ